MSEIIAFTSRQRIGARSRRSSPVWVPEYRHRWVGTVGVPSWTGRETLCRIEPNPLYGRKLHENPLSYVEVLGENGLPVIRDASPPDCEVAAFDWDEFERAAFADA